MSETYLFDYSDDDSMATLNAQIESGEIDLNAERPRPPVWESMQDQTAESIWQRMVAAMGDGA